MAKTTSDWVLEGSQAVRFHEEQGYLVKETYQPDRDAILKNNQEMRKAESIIRPDRNATGWYVGEIPLNDLPYVKSKYPEMFEGDRDQRRKALIRFTNDPEMRPYVIRGA